MIIGILGGIGSGKSTVAKLLCKRGCAVIDADAIAHEQLDKPDIKRKICEKFGKKILDSENNIDRKKLGDIVFSDSERIGALNSMIHPLVLSQTQAMISQFQGQPDVKAIVIDMPLLVESDVQRLCDTLIFVDCGVENRVLRSRFGREELEKREKFQISLDIKRNLAENTVDNNSELEILEQQIDNIFTNTL